MPRAPHHPPGAWPRLMRAATAAAYLDEPSVEAFLRRAGRVYPAGRRISGRGRVWRRDDLDRAVEALGERERAGTLADDL